MTDEEVVAVVEQENVIIVGDSKYPLIKKGRKQAEQVAGIARWLKVYGLPATKEIDPTELGTNGIQSIMLLIGGLSADALIDLYMVVSGCSKKEAEEYFDVAQLIDIAVSTYESQQSFKKVIDRFLPGLTSSELSETPPDESSMISEEPTDG